MILNFDEQTLRYGFSPVNDGAFYRARQRDIFSQVTAVTLTAAATASVVSTTSAAGSPTLQAGDLARVGQTIVVRGGGYCTTAASGQGNITFGIYLGGSCIATTPAIALTASQTKVPYWFDVRVTVTAVGASNTVQSTGQLYLGPLSAVIGGGFANGTTIGTQVPQTPPTVNTGNSLLIDVQNVLSTAVNTLVHTNTTIEMVF